MTRRRNLFLIAALFIFAGLMHFVIPNAYAAIMPSWIPFAVTMVYLSGVLEILGGIGVLALRPGCSTMKIRGSPGGEAR